MKPYSSYYRSEQQWDPWDQTNSLKNTETELQQQLENMSEKLRGLWHWVKQDSWFSWNNWTVGRGQRGYQKDSSDWAPQIPWRWRKFQTDNQTLRQSLPKSLPMPDENSSMGGLTLMFILMSGNSICNPPPPPCLHLISMLITTTGALGDTITLHSNMNIVNIDSLQSVNSSSGRSIRAVSRLLCSVQHNSSLSRLKTRRPLKSTMWELLLLPSALFHRGLRTIAAVQSSIWGGGGGLHYCPEVVGQHGKELVWPRQWGQSEREQLGSTVQHGLGLNAGRQCLRC